jgi:superfamily II DNA or RNA helicase
MEIVDLTESRSTLVDLARRRFGRIAPDLIADHVLAISHGADWPVRKAALEALARRYAFAARDGLRVLKHPEDGALGRYRTARIVGRKKDSRPYRTDLTSITPLRTSCSCADFVRSSLGLCKHGLVVLESLARHGGARSPRRPQTSARPAELTWDAQHPLEGRADRLARLRLRTATIKGFRKGILLASSLDDPRRRLALIDEIERQVARGAVRAEPAVATLLAEEKARGARRLENQSTSRECLATLPKLRRQLYRYQREGVARFFESGRLLLADDMGLGKTAQAIAACHGLFATGRVKRGLLIVPAALKSQWRREWEGTTDTPLQLVDGAPADRARVYAGTKRGFLMIGYEQLLRDFAHVERFQPAIVVLDEAQRIKNWATKSAGYVKALQPEFRLVLTGTPMENRFDELASIMDFVDDVALEPKWRLVPWHSMECGDGARGVMGARHLDTLRQRLSGSMLRRVRKEVLAQLPERTDTRIPIEMTDAQREAHADLDQPIAVLMSKAARRPLLQVEFLQLMQLFTAQRMICNGLAQVRFDEEWPRCQAGRPTGALLESLFAPKLAAFRGLVEQVVLEQKRKSVVFSQWRNMLRLAEWSVRDLLKEAGLRAVFFTGAESQKLRERAIVDFHDDPSAAVMFLSDAGGVGLNLQRAATCCVNLELPWNPAVLEQRIGRIHRLGQTAPIDVYNLVAEEGIEGRIATLVANKKAVFSSLFDGSSDQVNFNGQSSFLEGMRKVLEPISPPAIESVDEVGAEMPAALTRPDAVLPIAEDLAASGPSKTPTGLSITPLADGGLRIEAPPALAAPLAELLETIARSLRGASLTQASQNQPANGSRQSQPGLS